MFVEREFELFFNLVLARDSGPLMFVAVKEI